ncbi:hypothetical protein HMPREF9195_01467 [Treponema medium ATCC 700293]|uniref:Uncharacterized protein n=1 Tax=Treponema medium ATCC 700293 TaxID=1125700 RepID=A0AA87NRS8_TREMD|nr:hypothetical protein HMPREF9195_01467 [Treponema medium ATCC 700293]
MGKAIAFRVSQSDYFKFSIVNQQPRRKHRGTVHNVSHCVFYKVVAVGFNTLCYDAERCRGRQVLNPPHE